jgi:hypothetical protein
MGIFSQIEHILHNNFATFRCRLDFLKFLTFFMVAIAQVRSFIDWSYSWLNHRGDERRNLIKLIKLFLIDDISDSDDSLFSRYNLSLLFVVSGT